MGTRPNSKWISGEKRNCGLVLMDCPRLSLKGKTLRG
jgi:hypothetical protein